MASRWRGRVPQDGQDGELPQIFDREVDPDGLLLPAALELRSVIRAASPPEIDPAYRDHLRASLMAEARSRGRARGRRRRPLGSFFGLGMGLAGLAMIGVVLVSVLALPQGRERVVVQASVQGDPRVAVTQAIDLSFNQPMVEPSVVAGLKIQPAVDYTTRWSTSRRLSIMPRHNLVPNVAYEVTIARTAARAQNGATPLSNIVIPFGTAPLTSGAGSSPPSLVAVSQVATVQDPQALLYAPDGELLVEATGNSSVGGGSPSPLGPGPTVTSVYSLGNPQAAVASDTFGPAVSPDSQAIAYWSPEPSGGFTLSVSQIGGDGRPQVVASTTASAPAAAWLNDGALLYSGANGLFQVSLDGQVAPAYSFVKLGAQGSFLLAPGSGSLFSEPAGVPTLFDLATGSSTTIPGLVGTPAFSAQGTQVAYVVQQAGRDTVVVASGSGSEARPLVVAPLGVTISQLAFSPGGEYLAYVANTPGVGRQLGALAVSTGTSRLISTLTGMSLPVWSPEGTAISALQATSPGSAEVLTLQLSAPPLPTGTSAAASGQALVTASSLAQLQITGGPTALTAIKALLAPGTSIPPASLLPGQYDRFYAISSAPAAAGSNVYQVALELVRDPVGSAPERYLQETASVAVTGGVGALTGLTLGQPSTLPPGPMVISVTSTSSASGSVAFALQFDADLDPTTVGTQSVTLTSGGQTVSSVQVSYEAANRTVMVSATGVGAGPLDLTVGAPLADANHSLMAPSYQLLLPAPPAPSGG